MAETELERLAREEQAQLAAKPKTAAQKAAEAKNAANIAGHRKRTETTRALVEGLDVEDLSRDDGAVTADASLHPALAGATADEELSATIAEIKRQRLAWGAGLQQKLALPIRRAYHRHWFNDYGNRIEDAKSSGWAHINGSDGQPIKRVVGSARSGQPLVAFAMELPEAIWLEDLEAKNKLAEEQLEQVRQQPFRVAPGMSKKSDAGKFYSPHEDQGQGPIDVRKG